MTERTIFEKVHYNRQFHFNERIVAITVVSEPDSQILISSMQNNHGQTAVGVPGTSGADLIVAMSSVYAAAMKGTDATVRVGDFLKMSSVRVEGEWIVQFSNAATAFIVDLALMQILLTKTQVILNDALGEYRRQIAQIEADQAANGQRAYHEVDHSPAQPQEVDERLDDMVNRADTDGPVTPAPQNQVDQGPDDDGADR